MNDESIGNSPWVSLNICLFKVPYGKAIIAVMFAVAFSLLVIMFGMNSGISGFLIILVTSVSVGYAILQAFILFYSSDHIELISGLDYYMKRKNRFEINLDKI
jgi:hypothetical protein